MSNIEKECKVQQYKKRSNKNSDGKKIGERKTSQETVKWTNAINNENTRKQ